MLFKKDASEVLLLHAPAVAFISDNVLYTCIHMKMSHMSIQDTRSEARSALALKHPPEARP